MTDGTENRDGTEGEERRVIEIETVLDVPPEEAFRILTDPAEVSRWFPLEADIEPREGGRVWLSWGPGCEGEAPIHIHEPPRRFGWTERYGTDDEGRPIELAVDFHVETRDGVTVVRLVQSGFTDASDWDDMYDALVDGWRYFMFNLGHYVEHHLGTPRTMVWRRHPTTLERSEVWRRLVAAGLIPDAAEPDAPVAVRLDDDHQGTVVSARTGHHVACRLPELDRSLFFVELEGRHVGVWLSAYGLDEDRRAGLQSALDERLVAALG